MMPVIDIENFIGEWLLEPAHCRYQLGRAPVRGRYVIDHYRADQLRLESEWTNTSRRTHMLRFIGPIDGKPHLLAGSRIADSIQLEYVSPLQLNSSAWQAGRKVMWAERVLTLPDTLQIDMHGVLADGRVYTNTDVYRRVSKVS